MALAGRLRQDLVGLGRDLWKHERTSGLVESDFPRVIQWAPSSDSNQFSGDSNAHLGAG